MVAAAMKDVAPFERKLMNAKQQLKQGVDQNVADEEKQRRITEMSEAMTMYDERAKVAKNCIPKVSKAKAAPKPKAAA